MLQLACFYGDFKYFHSSFIVYILFGFIQYINLYIPPGIVLLTSVTAFFMSKTHKSFKVPVYNTEHKNANIQSVSNVEEY